MKKKINIKIRKAKEPLSKKRTPLNLKDRVLQQSNELKEGADREKQGG